MQSSNKSKKVENEFSFLIQHVKGNETPLNDENIKKIENEFLNRKRTITTNYCNIIFSWCCKSNKTAYKLNIYNKLLKYLDKRLEL
jgi:hypothetical protein